MTSSRPSSTSFWAAYLNYTSYGTDKVWRTVGGGIGVLYGPNSNSCATRVSYGLNYGGSPIQPFAGASINLSEHIYEGKAGDSKRYIVSAQQMRSYLRNVWGEPDHKPSTTQELQSIIASLQPGQCAIFATMGHAGALKQGYTDPYVTGYLPVDVWILPP